MSQSRRSKLPATSPAPEMEVIASKESQLFEKVYTQNKALSFFYRTGEISKKHQQKATVAFRACATDVVFGHRHDPDHDLYHQSPSDFAISHSHLTKGDEYYENFTPEEVHCMLAFIAQYEESANLCKDGKKDCLLSNTDKFKIENEYEKYYEQQKLNQKQIKRTPVPSLMNDFVTNLFSTAAYTFISTLLEKYIQPYLINQGYQPSYISFVIQTARSAALASLTMSPLRVVLDTVLRNGMNAILQYADINKDLLETINNGISKISTVIALTDTSKFASSTATTYLGATLGEMTAYELIHCLPKLKIEPELDNQPQISHTKQNHPTLRYRGHN